MAANTPTFSYTCEICGLEGFSDEEMRAHTLMYHVEGQATCPFCDLTDLSSDEMLIHVNQAHLDFLTPEAELMVFIDDQSPAFDEDSDTISESHTNNSSTPTSGQNGWHTPTSNGHGPPTPSAKPSHLHYGNSLRSTSQSSLTSNGLPNCSKSKKLPSQTLREAGTSKNKNSRENIHNGTGSDFKGTRKCESSLSKTKSKSKSTSRQNSIESVTSNNHNGINKNDYKNNSGNNSSSDYELSPAGSKEVELITEEEEENPPKCSVCCSWALEKKRSSASMKCCQSLTC